MRKILLWIAFGGIVYYAIEGIWRIPSNGGWAQISIALVGGFCFALISLLNQKPWFYKLSMRVQSVIAAIAVLAVEFLSGVILNLWLGLRIWDYSHLPFNIAGQVCLTMAFAWILLMPFAIWLEDRAELLYYLHIKAKRHEPVNLLFDDRSVRIYHSKTLDEDIYTYTLLTAYRLFLFGRA